MARGTGAAAQREWFARFGNLPAMIAQAVDTTAMPPTSVRGQASSSRRRRQSTKLLQGNAATPTQGGTPQLDNQTL
jgi:glutamate---cysteine ligase / carboxylate-amine ligase